MPQSDQLNSTESNRQGGKTQNPTGDATSHALPDHMHNPRDLGSAYVPLDSWIYPALDRLAALGYAERGFQGMRPWTRMECVRMIDKAKNVLSVLHPLSEDAPELLSRLEEEFSFEIGLQDGRANLNASLESAYGRTVSISGPALTDSYHFGQTVSYDFGRPFERGTNGQAGGAFRAEAGPFAVYVRAEYQHAPSAPAPSQAVLNVIALKDEVSLPPDVGIGGINRPRVLDAYIVMNLSPVKLSDWQLSVGRQSHSWGPGPGGSFLLSDNAEPIDMVEVVNPEPIRLPLLLKFLGPARIDQFMGRLANRTDHANPWVYGQKITFKPLPCLEIGYGRMTTIGGRGGQPFTLGNFALSMFGQESHNPLYPGVPGDNDNEMDWTFYVPKVRNYIVLYGEVYAEDDFIAWVRTTAYPYRPGIYITRIPGIPKLDLHIEAANTQTPGQNLSDNDGQFTYFDYGYHEANTNNGFLMGNTVGRKGQTIQGWLTYWASPRNTLQLMYKNNSVDPAFIPKGGAWQDYSVQNEFHRRSGWYVKSQLQYEHISHYPLLFNGRQQNVTAMVELGFMPNNKKRLP
ncbi:MAG: capsule assembly Wzi family protein [Terriglobales bacterium]